MLRHLLTARPTDHAHTFVHTVDDRLCVGPEGNTFLFGGAGLGLGISALEQAIGKPVIWANAHYRSFATPGQDLTTTVMPLASGRSVDQASASVMHGDRTICTVTATLGGRMDQIEAQWAEVPSVPAPEDCPIADIWPPQAGRLHEHLLIRMPVGGRKPGQGRMTVWLASRNETGVNAPLLALFADLAPAGVAAALGLPRGGNSLDNTLRMLHRPSTTDWVLCDIFVDGSAHGIAQTHLHLFDRTGRLVATGSQSVFLRS
ncbi:acyl-CoA thioesterase [Pseudooceanicola nitratireducens]|uniref:acyl-CoA thioesterase n=1 Tax=Pseudooceanicola nitratireducens TaxID=517719 RepID=UPI0023F2AA7E|nr:acyl-CoA thioesterase domain-containing protein [Pseudooceanicola nitratireducens]